MVGVDIISLTETNVHWKRPHVTSNFKKMLQDTWPEDSICTCTSNSDISWNSYYKPGGAAMISLNKITSATINKGEDPSGLGRLTFMTILGGKTAELQSLPCIDHVIAQLIQ